MMDVEYYFLIYTIVYYIYYTTLYYLYNIYILLIVCFWHPVSCPLFYELLTKLYEWFLKKISIQKHFMLLFQSGSRHLSGIS